MSIYAVCGYRCLIETSSGSFVPMLSLFPGTKQVRYRSSGSPGLCLCPDPDVDSVHRQPWTHLSDWQRKGSHTADSSLISNMWPCRQTVASQPTLSSFFNASTLHDLVIFHQAKSLVQHLFSLRKCVYFSRRCCCVHSVCEGRYVSPLHWYGPPPFHELEWFLCPVRILTLLLSYTPRGPFLLGHISPPHGLHRHFSRVELTLTVAAEADCQSHRPYFMDPLFSTNIHLSLLYTVHVCVSECVPLCKRSTLANTTMHVERVQH